MRGSPFANHNLSEAVAVERNFKEHMKRLGEVKGKMNLRDDTTSQHMIDVRRKHATSTRFRKLEEWREQDKVHNRLISKFKTIANGGHLSVERSGPKLSKDETQKEWTMRDISKLHHSLNFKKRYR